MEDVRLNFEQKLSSFNTEERQKILMALEYVADRHKDSLRASGEPALVHNIACADILLTMGMDSDSICAALLHDVLEGKEIQASNVLTETFGQDIVKLVQSLTKISGLSSRNKSLQEAASIRKMLFAMVDDIRVILIKLADKLHNMRTLKYLPIEKQKLTAQECLDIYAPLADRLGISWMKAELEDLSLKHLHRDVYSQIKELVALKKTERQEFLQDAKTSLQDEFKKANLEVQVYVRAKHFWSIYQKMRKRNKINDELYDLMGIRILCQKEEDCYTILGLVHRLYKPIEGRFKDYIAMPKSNGYKSLHTTVMANIGTLIEIQIRTHQMHQLAEFGVASHWLYKKGMTKDNVNIQDLPIINRLRDWKELKLESGEASVSFLDSIKQELLKDSIYVFTPQGKVIELPIGSTPIDFAYQIHTAIGDSCAGAKADGAIIALSAELKNTQVIEILTNNRAHPHINWLKFVKTSKARAKIRAWLLQNDESLIIDRNIVARKREIDSKTPLTSPEKRTSTSSKPLMVSVENQRDIMVHFARCCKPMTGDNIIGYVSRGRGIIVHRSHCKNLGHISEFSERRIDVQWETDKDKHLFRLHIACDRDSDIFSELESSVCKHQGQLIEGRLDKPESDFQNGSFTIELEKKEDLKKVLKSIRSNPSVRRISLFE